MGKFSLTKKHFYEFYPVWTWSNAGYQVLGVRLQENCFRKSTLFLS